MPKLYMSLCLLAAAAHFETRKTAQGRICFILYNVTAALNLLPRKIIERNIWESKNSKKLNNSFIVLQIRVETDSNFAMSCPVTRFYKRALISGAVHSAKSYFIVSLRKAAIFILFFIFVINSWLSTTHKEGLYGPKNLKKHMGVL